MGLRLKRGRKETSALGPSQEGRKTGHGVKEGDMTE